MLEQLLEQDEWVLRQKALSERKGFIEGEQRGELALLEIFVAIVQMRYPTLVELATQKVSSLRGVDALLLANKQMLATPDEATARFLLNTWGN